MMANVVAVAAHVIVGFACCDASFADIARQKRRNCLFVLVGFIFLGNF